LAIRSARVMATAGCNPERVNWLWKGHGDPQSEAISKLVRQGDGHRPRFQRVCFRIWRLLPTIWRNV